MRCSLHKKGLLAVALVLLLLAPASHGAEEAIAPTVTDLAYGPHERNVMDLWLADSPTPTPMVLHFHGGGFVEGDKTGFRRHSDRIERCLDAGMSVASVNYRFIEDAPLGDILRDCARAVQYLRHNAGQWNLDKERFAAFGESAGASASLWLAFHDELADPESADPVLRESSRLRVAGAYGPQSTYDFARWPEILDIPQAIWHVSNWYVSPSYYHLSGILSYLSPGQAVRADLDFLAQVDAQDPPIYLQASQEHFRVEWKKLAQWALAWIAGNAVGKEIALDPEIKVDILHHPAHVKALEEACAEQGVTCTAVYKEGRRGRYIDLVGYLVETLQQGRTLASATAPQLAQAAP